MKSARFYGFLIFSLFSFATVAQCPAGAVGVATGGCLSGCNLTALGGPNCGSGTSGNGPVQTVTVDIPVPSGCTYTVTATMRLRPAQGCSSGTGADGGDGMKVDIPSGPKALQSGASDATLNDSYTVTGPGTIRVTCVANRRDEIVTYTTVSSGAFCVNCVSVLPIELSAFDAMKSENYVDLTWSTESERDNESFIVERSEDGKLFEPIGVMPGAGNSASLLRYTMRDNNPPEGTVYYRLKQTDFDGAFTYSQIRSVHFDPSVTIYPNPSNTSFRLKGKNLGESQVMLTNAIGEQVDVVLLSREKDNVELETENLPEGMYFVTVLLNEGVITHKLAIKHLD